MTATMTVSKADAEVREAVLKDVFPSLSSEGVGELARISIAVSYDEGELVAQQLSLFG